MYLVHLVLDVGTYQYTTTVVVLLYVIRVRHSNSMLLGLTVRQHGAVYYWYHEVPRTGYTQYKANCEVLDYM